MKKYFFRLFNKVYKETQNIIDNIIFFPLKIKKSSPNYQNILKYGFLKIFPEKNSYFSYLKILGKELKLNTKIKNSKKIISMGTCFSEQIHLYFSEIHNVIENVETNKLGFAADWGRITSIEHLFRLTNFYIDGDIDKHVIIKSLDGIENSKKFKLINSFINHSSGFEPSKNRLIIDNSREHLTIHSSKCSYSKTIKSHLSCARKAIKNCDTIFLTLGQSGYFQDKYGNFYAKKPSSLFSKIESIKFIEDDITDIQLHIEKLESCIENLRNLSNDPKIFISLSPVPANAYFGLNKKSILEYHWFSKSFLYQVINNVISNDNSLNYIPTFESTMSANLSSLSNDLRHLKTGFRDKMFNSLLN